MDEYDAYLEELYDEYLEELKEKYIQRGCIDYKLTTIEDLKSIYQIDCNSIHGYKNLINPKLFENFIINFYNAWGLEARTTIKPIAVKHCNDESNGTYLRFEYKIYTRKEWLHVKNATTWY
ncbi:hypothetical protein [Abyssisolibacter fermentans]|uniref:hypothetical protein n=1 Tax=Abyssisolibacter fermentans TaxID=1766203 RepID=UPI0008313720|nr:hypothetical protein [Abyssisolibacter fermentans]